MVGIEDFLDIYSSYLRINPSLTILVIVLLGCAFYLWAYYQKGSRGFIDKISRNVLTVLGVGIVLTFILSLINISIAPIFSLFLSKRPSQIFDSAAYYGILLFLEVFFITILLVFTPRSRSESKLKNRAMRFRTMVEKKILHYIYYLGLFFAFLIIGLLVSFTANPLSTNFIFKIGELIISFVILLVLIHLILFSYELLFGNPANKQFYVKIFRKYEKIEKIKVIKSKLGHVFLMIILTIILVFPPQISYGTEINTSNYIAVSGKAKINWISITSVQQNYQRDINVNFIIFNKLFLPQSKNDEYLVDFNLTNNTLLSVNCKEFEEQLTEKRASIQFDSSLTLNDINAAVGNFYMTPLMKDAFLFNNESQLCFINGEFFSGVKILHKHSEKRDELNLPVLNDVIKVNYSFDAQACVGKFTYSSYNKVPTQIDLSLMGENGLIQATDGIELKDCKFQRGAQSSVCNINGAEGRKFISITLDESSPSEDTVDIIFDCNAQKSS